MFNVETIPPARFDAVADLLVEANDAPYALQNVIQEKLRRPGFRGQAEVLGISESSQLSGAILRCGRFIRLIGVARAERRKGIGTALLHEAERRARGEANLVIGAEPGNYFTPGVWTGSSGTIAFFESSGYAPIADAANMRADLTALTTDPDSQSPIGIRRPRMEERARVAEYVAGTFGKIWSFEADFAFEHPSPSIFIAEDDGRIVGFSAHLANNAGLPWYGPTGVSSSARGRGWGRGLLLASLGDLQVRGFNEAIIAWAAAHDFYTSIAGARVAERFVIFEKNFAPDRGER